MAPLDGKEILIRAQDLRPFLVECRRWLHRHPELSFQEQKTRDYVVGRLQEMGLQPRVGLAETGVTALVTGGLPGPAVALRADMDALPMTEATEASYASENDGVMHACGHDAHTAMLLGAARLLQEARAGLPGQVLLIFQPAEESPPGGAKLMIEAGVLENPQVAAIFGLHVDPFLDTGKIGFKPGPLMAAADKFVVDIIGEGGHGAAPHQAVDAVVVAAQVVLALQSVVSRQVDPLAPAVVSIGTIDGGNRYNVIADRVTLTGTIRTLNPVLRERIPELIQRLVRGVTSAYGARFQFDYTRGYPVMINDPEMTDFARTAAAEILGPDSVATILEPSMGGEDFAYFLQQVPGCYAYLGTSRIGATRRIPWHHPRFNIDEEALAIGAAYLAGTAERFLLRHRGG